MTRADRKMKLLSFSSLLFSLSLFLQHSSSSSSSSSLLPPHEHTYLLGPFAAGNIRGNLTTSAESVTALQLPVGTFGVIFWGDWRVLDAATLLEIPRGVFFLHHINIFEWKGHLRLAVVFLHSFFLTLS